MKSYRVIGALCMAIAVSLCSGVTIAQAQMPPSQYERVKGMADFIGLWSGDFTAPNGPEGKLVLFCRWTSNKSYAQLNIVFRAGDERPLPIGTTLVGWSGEEEQLYAWSFWPDSQARGKAAVEGGKLHYKSGGTTVDGLKTSADVRYHVDGDTMTVTVTDRRRGDSDLPDMHIKLKRQQRPQRRRDAQ